MAARGSGTRIRFDLRKKLSVLFTLVLLVNALLIIAFSLAWGYYQAREEFFRTGIDILDSQANSIAEYYPDSRWNANKLNTANGMMQRTLEANPMLGFVRFYMPNGRLRLESRKDGADFRASEFRAPFKIDRLCDAIEKDGYIDFVDFVEANRIRAKSIVWLDYFLNTPNFYDLWKAKRRGTTTPAIEKLARSLESARRQNFRKFTDLTIDEQHQIRQLNRLIIAASYRGDCPPFDRPVLAMPPRLSLEQLKAAVRAPHSLASTVIQVVGMHEDDARGTVAAYIEMGYDPDHFFAQLWHQTLPAHLGLVVLLLLISLLLTYGLAARISRPLREVIAVTDEIAKGREFREVTTRSTDEAGVIAGIFNDAYRRMQGRLNNMAVLQACTLALGSQLEREQVYQLIVKTFVDNSGAQKAVLLLLEPDRSHLVIAGGWNVISAKCRLAAGEGLAGRAIQAAAPAQADGLRNLPDWCFFYPDQPSAPTGTPTLAIPIVIQERAAGVILLTECAGRENKPFDREEVLLYETLAGAAAGALENARLYELAITDELTGIYVRRYYYQRLDHELDLAAKQQSPLVLMMLDIDHFKSFNDRFGHQTGDQVLIALARLMRETVRDIDVVQSSRRRDIVARYGGEEFSVILPGTPAEGGLLVAERLRQNVERFDGLVSDQGEPLKVAISLGVAVWEPGLDREQLIHRADDALYVAKRLGRNCVVLAGRDQPEPKG